MGELKTVLLLGCLLLFLTQVSIKTAYGLETAIISGDGFGMYFPNGSIMGLVLPKYQIEITVLNGTINTGSGSASMRAYDKSGYLDFYSQNSNILRVEFTGSLDDVSIICSNGQIVKNSGNDRDVTIYFTTTGNVKRIGWQIQGIFYFNYVIDWLGVFGIGLMIIAPVYVIRKFKDGLNEGSYQALGYGFLLFVIGFGLVLTWIL